MAKLYFYYGTMGARKTAEAIMTAYNYEEKGMFPFCISPAIDTRSGKGKWKSRIGIEREVDLVLYTDTKLFDVIKRVNYGRKIDVIIIDEAQFLTDEQVWDLAMIVQFLKIPVICFGLRTDFKGNLFEGSYRLMCLADKLEEIKSMTYFEGKEVRTMMNAKYNNEGYIFDGDSIDVGGDEKYKAVCLKEWLIEYIKYKNTIK